MNLMAGNPHWRHAPKGPQEEDLEQDLAQLTPNYPCYPVSAQDAGRMNEESIFPEDSLYQQGTDTQVSQELENLVSQCLKWDVQNRPSLNKIDEAIAAFEGCIRKVGITRHNVHSYLKWMSLHWVSL